MTRSHVISQEKETCSSPEVKKVFICYKVIIEIAQEVETSSQEVRKGYLPGRRLFPKVRKHNIGAVDLCGKNKLSSLESSKNRLGTRSHVIFHGGNMKFPWKWKRVFIWYEVLIEISQKVEGSSPEVRKGFYLVEGNNRDFPGSGNEFP